MLLGVDTGGTFTDFVVLDEQGLRVHKVLSTPQAPEQAILQGVQALGLSLDDGLRVVHGSTVATNAVLEGKGVRTAYITNTGLADVLSIGRQARRELYNLQPVAAALPVERELCLEVPQRLSAEGDVLQALDDAGLAQLRQQLLSLAPDAVAINLLFSFLDDTAERAVEAVVPEGMFVSRSSHILPEYREYERGMTTWLNAYVGPLVQGYLERLQEGLAPATLSVMQSAGGTIDAAQAGQQAVHLLLSGPAGGLAGARFMGRACARERLLTFDMGGTSTDVALIDGDLRLTSQGEIAGYPVSVPMVDMHTIGAGGGSVASVDAGGLLQVGPTSAGAAPGPACYGRGGERATVTDANLVLGRLRADAFLGGEMPLDVAAAVRAVGRIAEALETTVEAAAEGILRVANEHMARALRVISVQRGVDPRDFTLMSFGGAGGVHVCALAEALGMREALVPVHGGVLSALGMLAAPRARQLSRTLNGRLTEIATEVIDAHIQELVGQGRQSLLAEGVPETDLQIDAAVDLCYRGQSYTFTVAWQGHARSSEAFHAAHKDRYGHRLDLPVELVNVRVGLRGPEPEPVLQALEASGAALASNQVAVFGEAGSVPVYARETLAAGQALQGPGLITETVSTTWLARGWQASVHKSGSLLLSKEA
ncbi:hydantoinase/oxoprolinase family protein [Sulfuriflexus sp.]|uniref:hydantoinase/oxoprolinase family protein n=1 Tax=Sulfuriflexus sp. TaxID=2015443 RepID=UPI0028D12A62|nr:hydantoinase/oxoprolinase family protein [Sulfuriflexus sp.]